MKDLELARSCEDLTKYAYVALRRFPKSERHVLSQELRNGLWRMLRLAVTIGKRYHKKTTLQELDIEVELMRRKIRLAMELEFLPFKQYEVWARHLDEVGRITGGWIQRLKPASG
jgi:hypothetical protein